MQMMVIEYGRNVLGYADANSVEMDQKTPHNVIDIMEDQKNITNMGGTMRLGGYECALRKGSKVSEIYGTDLIRERHRHRYEFNNDFKEEYEKAGMECVGTNPETGLVEIVEVPSLRWYVGTQFHPEYSSTVLKPHPLFLSFVKLPLTAERPIRTLVRRKNKTETQRIGMSVWKRHFSVLVHFPSGPDTLPPSTPIVRITKQSPSPENGRRGHFFKPIWIKTRLSGSF